MISPHRRLPGFSLVEVTVALGISVFCLVVVFGLLSVGFNTSSLAVEQTTATNLLSAVASDLRTAPNSFPNGSTGVTTALYQLAIPAAGAAAFTLQRKYLDANGQVLLTPTAAARYQLNVTGTMPGVGSRGATIVCVMLSWPAAASLTSAAGSVETLVALDRN